MMNSAGDFTSGRGRLFFAFVSKNDEFCIKNEKSRIKNEKM